jgi:hypothetical protein
MQTRIALKLPYLALVEPLGHADIGDINSSQLSTASTGTPKACRTCTCRLQYCMSEHVDKPTCLGRTAAGLRLYFLLVNNSPKGENTTPKDPLPPSPTGVNSLLVGSRGTPFGTYGRASP